MYGKVISQGLRRKAGKGKRRPRALDVLKTASSLGRGTCLKSLCWERILAKCVRRDRTISVSVLPWAMTTSQQVQAGISKQQSDCPHLNFLIQWQRCHICLQHWTQVLFLSQHPLGCSSWLFHVAELQQSRSGYFLCVEHVKIFPQGYELLPYGQTSQSACCECGSTFNPLTQEA